MRIITVENEKIAVPSANECVGNSISRIHTKRGKYLMVINIDSNIDTVANKFLYTTTIEISVPLYRSKKYDHILTKYGCGLTVNDGSYVIYHKYISEDIPNTISVYETAVSLLP